MKYILNYFISFACILGVIATFNWFVDPFGMHWSPKLSNINALKPEAGTRTRITKAYQANIIAPDVLIVGNSRVEMGLSPSSPLFNNKTVYNQGMPGAHLVMHIDYAINTIKTTPNIKEVLVGIDFVDFLITHNQANEPIEILDRAIKKSYNFRLESYDNDNKYAAALRLKEKMALVFSLDALSASLKTLTQQKSLSSGIDELGFNSALSYLSIMKTEGIKPLFTQKLQAIADRLKNPLYITSLNKPSVAARLIHLKSLIEETKQRNIKVTLFINPYHFSYLHVLAEYNQWQNFITWKKDLTSFVNKLNATEDSLENVLELTLWDFSGFNTMTNEAVLLETPKKTMHWFWEPAHYRKALGNKMLESMLNENKSNHRGFGKILLPKNIQLSILEDNMGLKKSKDNWLNLKERLALSTID